MSFARAMWWAVAWSKYCGRDDRPWSKRGPASHHARTGWERVHECLRIGPRVPPCSSCPGCPGCLEER